MKKKSIKKSWIQIMTSEQHTLRRNSAYIKCLKNTFHSTLDQISTLLNLPYSQVKQLYEIQLKNVVTAQIKKKINSLLNNETKIPSYYDQITVKLFEEIKRLDKIMKGTHKNQNTYNSQESTIQMNTTYQSFQCSLDQTIYEDNSVNNMSSNKQNLKKNQKYRLKNMQSIEQNEFENQECFLSLEDQVIIYLLFLQNGQNALKSRLAQRILRMSSQQILHNFQNLNIFNRQSQFLKYLAKNYQQKSSDNCWFQNDKYYDILILYNSIKDLRKQRFQLVSLSDISEYHKQKLSLLLK